MNKEKSNTSKRIRKFYFLSLLCLIPFLGAIVAIILLIYAIFVFKSFKLLFIVSILSIGGILFNSIEGKIMEKELKYGKESSILFSELSAEFLDSISTKLEIYKIKNGHYPESLLELKAQYPRLIITDPLLERNSEAHKQLYFYYHLNGEKYILFSSGIDCIPNTADDIFPKKP